MLVEYIGLGRRQTTAFKTKNSRWVSIVKNYPGIYASEQEMGLLDQDDELSEPEKGGSHRQGEVQSASHDPAKAPLLPTTNYFT